MILISLPASFPRKRESSDLSVTLTGKTTSISRNDMSRQPAVYILTNKNDGTLYIGVTSDLVKRVYEHKSHVITGFTHKYNLQRLVYFEMHNDMVSAITREKQLKKWNRPWKIELIETHNPDWKDLYPAII
jgi:putative endonuclease